MTAAAPDLRTLVAAVVRDVVTEMVGDAVRDGLGASGQGAAAQPAARLAPPPAAPDGHQAGARTPGAEHTTPADLRTRTETVRITGDGDLDAFARQLLNLFENPKNRQDLRAGRLRFRLAPTPGAAGAAPAGPAERIETGAVTERHVKAAADAGRRLVLGRRAVLTPLAREKARALGVPIEKER